MPCPSVIIIEIFITFLSNKITEELLWPLKADLSLQKFKTSLYLAQMTFYT